VHLVGFTVGICMFRSVLQPRSLSKKSYLTVIVPLTLVKCLSRTVRIDGLQSGRIEAIAL
jgi:hypothetical protein